ncbi:MAG: DUF2339 domain-containing protein, partial [Ferruginibacter sp.]
MELLLFIALVVIFIIVLNIQKRQQKHADHLNNVLSNFNTQLQNLKSELQKTRGVNTIIDVTQDEKEKEVAALKAQEEYKQRIAEIEALQQQQEEKRKAEEESLLQDEAIVQSISTEVPVKKIHHAPPPKKESWIDTWLKNNPDLEKFIGENLFNKIGIAVLVFGIGFFVKFAIDKNWINEYGRVAIGLFCGIILISLAHYLLKSYRSFSSVLAGGGIAVFYFTIGSLASLDTIYK